MKKTVTVNLDKTIFNIDDDAYTVLESYLEALHDHFKKEEGGQEIMNDIESRISELFKERLGFGMQVITLQEVNEVIYNPQIQISEKSQTKRLEIADSRKTKRPITDKRTTPNKRHSNAIITL